MSESRGRWWSKTLLEVVLIGVAVFLGMAADQWRSDQQHRARARSSLQNFRAEMQANEKAILAETEYHGRVREQIGRYLDPKTRPTVTLKLEGVRPVQFEHTAWDLALATQALADIDKDLAFEIARVYGQQERYIGLTEGLTQAMYLRPPEQDLTVFLQSLKVYYDDIVLLEPGILDLYRRVLPMVDRALID